MLKRTFRLAAPLACALWFGSPAIAAAADPVTVTPPSTEEFQAWLDGFKATAKGRGISQATLDKAFTGTSFIKRVIELDRRQPEFTMTFWQYIGKTISDKRIARGREMLKTHAKLLKQVEDKFGVPPRFLVAFWGLESNFGDYTARPS